MARLGIAQDDARENRIIDLFNLVRPADRVRHGTDAMLLIDGHEIEFELKSVTTARGGVSTVRDLGPDHIAKWRHKHWIVGFYNGAELLYCRYGSPDSMAPWIAKTWEYIRPDFELAELTPQHVTAETMARLLGNKEFYTLADAKKLHKNQLTSSEYKGLSDHAEGYTPERMLEILRERVKYIMRRGSTLNNPHIQAEFMTSWPKIFADHAVTLRELVRDWLRARPAESLAPGDMT